MKTSTFGLHGFILLGALACLSILNPPLSTCSAQGTAFTYEGKLQYNGSPGNGLYDLQFALFNAASGGTQQGSTFVADDLAVTNSLFTVPLDFGAAAFTGQNLWLQIAVRTNGVGPYTNLSPRQQVMPMPYAIRSLNAGTASNLAGLLPSAQLSGAYASALTLSNAANSFSGSGAGLTGLNASQLTSGTVPDARLSANIPRLSAPATFTGLPTALTTLGNISIGTAGSGAGPSGKRLEIFTPTVADGVNLWGTAPAYLLGDALNTERAALGYASGAGSWSEDAVAGDIVFRATTGRLLLQTGVGSAGLTLNNNQVGIGTDSPASPLHVVGRITTGLDFSSAGAITFRPPDGFAYFHMDNGPAGGRPTGRLRFSHGVNPGDFEVLSMTQDGRVGIGTTTPSRMLEIVGPADVEIGLTSTDDDGRPWTIQSSGTHGNSLDGTFQIIDRTPGAEAARLIIYPNGRVSVGVLTLTGGADLAEPFQMSGKDIPKGAVVVIDEANPGRLKMSDRAYDRRVAGIVSGANGIIPGIQLSQQGLLEGGQDVALSGRVYALADATDTPIKPGDLLTTSAVPGHCMKASVHDQAQGAILGKAMTGLKEGRGRVLVLVTLQ